MNEKYLSRLISFLPFLPFLLAILMPEWAYASSTSSFESNSGIDFSPPAQDMSVVFLSNIFGVVDGVLHGTGSQIIGQMFGVFNSAVLALGGMVAIYTTLVGTMNTAQEGEMLGKKWSSIWIPTRTVFGISMLIPKTTGYCVMQIFVMWVVVQGIGAADKVWDSALSYLQRGGVIIQPNVDPKKATTMAGGAVMNAAKGILVGQVCMKGLQNILADYRQDANNNADKASSACYKSKLSNKDNKAFCSTVVPDFLGSMNLSSPTKTNTTPTYGPDGKTLLYNTYHVPMPDFGDKSTYPLYNKLSGICGQIQWKSLTNTQTQSLQNDSGQSQSESEASNKSRNIAVQQMFNTLENVATSMVQNDPNLSAVNCDDDSCVSSNAKLPLGLPVTNSNGTCSGSDCQVWGLTGSGGTTLLTGSELAGSVQDYAGIMLPTLQSLSTASDPFASAVRREETKFIANARQQGWLMAGAYFFKLAKLNIDQMGASGLGSDTAKNSGLSVPAFSNTNFENALISNKCTAGIFCTILGSAPDGLPAPYKNLVNLIGGGHQADESGGSSTAWNTLDSAEKAMKENGKSLPYYGSLHANSVYTYLANAPYLVLPGQPGQSSPKFKMHFNFSPSSAVHQLPPAHFSGGFMGIPGLVTTMVYNGIARGMFNMLLSIAMPIVSELFFLLVSPPILLLSSVFNAAVIKLQDPSINPIIALATMGGAYINGFGELWVIMAATVAGFGMLPPVFALLMMVLPVVGAWMGVMLGVGINCAYYVPFIPFLMFIFGVFAWLIAVVESMVAAPIVALGITHPEGHEAFGKGEQAVMLILNVFLRPAMMIFGYIFGIILSYVGVWLINTGYGLTLGDIYDMSAGASGAGSIKEGAKSGAISGAIVGGAGGAALGAAGGAAAAGFSELDSANKNYTQWTGLFMYFFSILIYTAMYVAVVQKSFQLIYLLPDKVLRWIGGTTESFGSEVAGDMAGKVEKQAGEGVGATKEGLQALGKQGRKKQGDKGGDKQESTTEPMGGGDGPGGMGGGGPGGGGMGGAGK